MDAFDHRCRYFILALLVQPPASDMRRVLDSNVSGDSKRSFVQFILEPLYKIYSYVLGAQGQELSAMLDEIGVVGTYLHCCAR